MRHRAMCLIGVLSTGLCLSSLSADDVETVVIRGETFTIWPFEDLIARGFDLTPIPREGNSAWVLIDAVNAYADLPTDLKDAFDYAVATAWPEGCKAGKQLSDYLEVPENRRAMELVGKAATMSAYQMPCFGDPRGSVLSILLPNLSQMRFLSKLMVVDGRRLNVRKEFDDATDRYTTVMRMGGHVGEGVTLIEGLVGIAIWSAAERALVDMVLREPLSRKQLKLIQAKLGELAPRLPKIDRGLQGERAFGPAMVDELCSRPLKFFSNLPFSSEPGGDITFASDGFNVNPQDGWGRLELRIGRLIYPDRTMKRHMLGYYDKVLERAAKGPHEAANMAFDEEQYVQESIPKWDVVSRMLLPSLARATTIGERVKADFAIARAMVAIRIYMLDHYGKVPATLQDVAEELPESTFADPFSGDLLVYRPTDEGFVLYSVGPNLVDDGGQAGKRWDELDLTYSLPPKALEQGDTE